LFTLFEEEEEPGFLKNGKKYYQDKTILSGVFFVWNIV
jgi:hypothetical protein